ncbi:Zinc finger fyve domain-containing protein 1 [Plakobranchus ocellatus]|uniref:Zinc finger fyve domain-containing protein 1 n=1 Tax=Plakobranchus ocellatus TaxID=259542 RepID=A0AAV4C7S8_9GAST|nr:Zinc finger fyve domain-containing protein 1 [Plakobranchus ocellatus]
MIKPVAPYSLDLVDGDESMTFCSFPQESDTLTNNMAFVSSNSSFLPESERKSAIVSTNGNQSINQLATDVLDRASLEDSFCESQAKSFLLLNDQEVLQVTDQDEFVEKLGCDRHDVFKVISIFGNTGDGKSFTLNHLFFGGKETFKTSVSQSSCTMGVWCALDHRYKTVVIDTEGLLGSSSNENQRLRLLLKVLAVSDIVIYRTRAERLHNDMFVFLSNASKAYCKHFMQELKSASEKFGITESSLGPVLVVFQETTHTETLKGTKDRSEHGVLRDMFYSSGNPIDAFNSVFYVGIRTAKLPTDFVPLQDCVVNQLKDKSVRASRKPEIIFRSLKALNDKFSQDIEAPQLNTFPDQYFTCTSKCLACNARCELSMNHDINKDPHDPGRGKLCEYQSQYGNKVFMCKTCLKNKKQVIVVPKTSSSSDSSWFGLTKYIWSGYVYECPNCGVIYRSREHWYGNEEEDKVLHVEFRHVWPQGPSCLDSTHNAAWKVLEGFHYVADTISSVSAKPTKYLSEWTADQINPSYWVPNSEIIKCAKCHQLFDCAEQKHHCRACGKGFCMDCSSNKRPVPERGWGLEPVRVCDDCLEPGEKKSDNTVDQSALTARKVGEAVSSTINVVASAFDYPLGMIKNSARPGYWVPDDQITACCVCSKSFGPRLAIHHCRACGQGVCEECSLNKRHVPLRGWDYPVRVCNLCEKKTDRI